MKWYTEVSVKTFCTDDDGLVLDSIYKTGLISGEDAKTLKKSVSFRVESIVEDSSNILTNRVNQ